LPELPNLPAAARNEECDASPSLNKGLTGENSSTKTGKIKIFY